LTPAAAKCELRKHTRDKITPALQRIGSESYSWALGEWNVIGRVDRGKTASLRMVPGDGIVSRPPLDPPEVIDSSLRKIDKKR